MPAKLIIACTGRPAVNGQRRRKFVWNPKYNAYVYEGREFGEREINDVIDVVIRKNSDLRPYMKVVQFSDEATATFQQTVHTTDPTPPAGADGSRIITLQEALAVVEKIAPERLKKTPGKKPAMVEV